MCYHMFGCPPNLHYFAYMHAQIKRSSLKVVTRLKDMVGIQRKGSQMAKLDKLIVDHVKVGLTFTNIKLTNTYKPCTFPLSHCKNQWTQTLLDLILALNFFPLFFFFKVKTFSSNQGQWKVTKIALNTSTHTWIVPFIWHCTCHPLISKEFLMLCLQYFHYFFLKIK